MNIFILDNDIELCARYHIDKHVVKMILETTQLLNNARIQHDPGYSKIYRPTHLKHPCTLWVCTNKSNFHWLNRLGLALCEEYTYRYGKTHKCQEILEFFHNSPFEMPKGELTPFVQCMPDKYHNADAILAYREYYRQEKRGFAKWTKRPNPEWWF